MVAIRIAELRERADEIVRRLRETGEPVEIFDEGHVVAKLVPSDEGLERIKDEQTIAALAELDRLSEEIAASVPPGTTLHDFMGDLRRGPGATASDLPEEEDEAETAAIWDDLQRLSLEIGKRWPDGVSAVEAVRDVRRDL
jgi:antitoxin (DNA-binding transcriptional repressor) of toxin-antitoxin stability system